MAVRHHTMASIAMPVAAVALGLAGCQAAKGLGSIDGNLPLCFGPGPGTNLMPRTTVEAVQGGRVVAREAFATSAGHASFSMLLKEGTYKVRLPSLAVPPQTVHVTAHRSTHLTFADPGCL